MSWLTRLLRRNRLETELDKELRYHLEQHTCDLVARGHSPEEARRIAMLSLGGREQVMEECRDARGTRWLEDFVRDSRYTLRNFRQKPGFTAVALLTFALGCGAVTVMFTLINGVLLKPLPYPEPDRLVAIHGQSKGWNVAAFGEQNVAYLDFLDCRRDAQSLDIAGWLFNSGTLSEPGEAEYDLHFEISSNLFSTLGERPVLGRTFTSEEDRPGGEPVALLGYSIWQRRFAASPTVLGTSLVMDAKRYTIVGVAPRDLLPDDEGDVYTPVGQDTAGYLQNRRAHPIGALARLKPGVTLAQAQSELEVLSERLGRQYPDTNKDRGFTVRTLRPNTGNAGSTLLLLMGAVSLLLLIACVNIASLLLARAVSRQRELAMRVALGASGGRLARQCLTESAVLAVSGGLIGLAVAALGIRPFVACWPGTLPRAEAVHLDWRVMLFALGVSIVCGVMFGLAPAVRAFTQAPEHTLRAGGRGMAGASRKLHRALVVSEIALALVLLAGAGMLGRTILRLSAIDPGLKIHNVLVARMALSPASLANPAKIRAAWQDVLDRSQRAAGVQSVTIVDTVPLRAGNNQNGYWTSAALPPANEQPLALSASVTPQYLKVMGIPLLEGRFFDDRDRMGNLPVIVIDEVLARKAFPGQDALGKDLWIPDLGSGSFRIIGIAGHVRYWGLAGDDQAQVRAQFYYPFAQVPDAFLRRWSELMSLAIRSDVDPLTLVAPLRQELRGGANDQVLYDVRTMEQLARQSIARQRFLMLLFGIFAGLALLLACVGIYGVLAYLTSQRVPEIGIRMALGAEPGEIMWMVQRESLTMILLGVTIGAVGAWAGGSVLQRLVEGMQPMIPSTLAAVLPVLLVTALLASSLPARRASRVDPVLALRQD